MSELVIFDLDGTLLNKASRLSPYTLDTLKAMDKAGVNYTIATGRSFQSAAEVIEEHDFLLPHIYTNGVLTWCPTRNAFSFDNCLSVREGREAIDVLMSDHVAPFLTATDEAEQQYIFHPPFRNDVEASLLAQFQRRENARIVSLDLLDTMDDLHVTNVSMIGPSEEVLAAERRLQALEHLVSYSGPAIKREDYRWLDAHHVRANKGAAVEQLKTQLALSTVICFGDSDNDMSMFHIADECYAPENAKAPLKAMATEVIGHHDEDGVAAFLRERFNL